MNNSQTSFDGLSAASGLSDRHTNEKYGNELDYPGVGSAPDEEWLDYILAQCHANYGQHRRFQHKYRDPGEEERQQTAERLQDVGVLGARFRYQCSQLGVT